MSLTRTTPDLLPLEGETVQQAVDRINADPSRFKAVLSNAVLEWLGGNAREVKLTRFQTANVATEDPQAMVLLGAVNVVFRAAYNSTSYLSLEPGSDQRSLLLALTQYPAAKPVLTEDDAAALLAKAVLYPEVTADDVAAAVAGQARAAAFAAVRNAEQIDHVRRVGLIDAAERDGLPAPSLADLNAAEGT